MIFVAWNLIVSVLKDHTQSQLYNCSVISTGNAAERTCPEAKRDNPNTGQPSRRLATLPRELNITLKPQCKDDRKTWRRTMAWIIDQLDEDDLEEVWRDY
jgi:hypothetical protein